MTREEILNSVGEFSWFWNEGFFVETSFGNFHWKDPDYGGDNSFTKVNMNYKQFCYFQGVGMGRDKGKHIIKNYCGDQIKIVGL